MNRKIFRLVAGIALIVVGVSQFAYNQSSYIFSGGLIVWGLGSLLLAWSNNNGGNVLVRLANALYLVGCLVTVVGLFMRG